MSTCLFSCQGHAVPLDRPIVMGVLNVTPDSFSDGGQFATARGTQLSSVLVCAERMLADGARVLDVGGESTRPGALPVSEQEELDRVVPVVEALAAEVDAVISVDTSSPAVMRESIRAGATLINDVRALRRPGALQVVAEAGVHACLMHMRGEPATMQLEAVYDDVVEDVKRFLAQRISACQEAGIAREKILIDPGFGFAKTPEQNLILLNRLSALGSLGCPVLAGLSRKSLIGAVLGRQVHERLFGSLALAVMAVAHGARVVRVHDVRETVDAVRMADAVLREAIQ